MNYIQKYNSPLGKIILTSNGENLTGLYFDGQKYFNGYGTEKNLSIFEQTKNWLDIYFCGNAPNFTPPLNFQGTEFQKKVWQILLKIPFGETKTYGEIAKMLKTSARAVGNAVAHNPISLIVPCHRVIGFNGNLTGYAGGLDKKIKLLELENFESAKVGK